MRRDDAADPTAVEAGEGDVAGLVVLAEQQACDEEAGDHEEHVDSDEAATGPPGQVVEDHREDGERAQTLDVPTAARTSSLP